MRDKRLENKLRLISLQLDSWKKLHDLITYGLDKTKPIISVDQERQLPKCVDIYCRKSSTCSANSICCATSGAAP